MKSLRKYTVFVALVLLLLGCSLLALAQEDYSLRPVSILDETYSFLIPGNATSLGEAPLEALNRRLKIEAVIEAIPEAEGTEFDPEEDYPEIAGVNGCVVFASITPLGPSQNIVIYSYDQLESVFNEFNYLFEGTDLDELTEEQIIDHFLGKNEINYGEGVFDGLVYGTVGPKPYRENSAGIVHIIVNPERREVIVHILTYPAELDDTSEGLSMITEMLLGFIYNPASSFQYDFGEKA